MRDAIALTLSDSRSISLLSTSGTSSMSKKKYIVRCPHCNHRVFDADYADVEIRYPVCKKVFEVKLEKKAG